MSQPQQQQAVPAKAQKYEEFLNNRLRIDLNKALKRKDLLKRRLRDFNETEIFIQKADVTDGSTLKTQIDLGQQFFVSAEIENRDKLVIDVGLGIFVELSYKEAKEVIFQQKMEIERLLRKVDIDIVDINTKIKMFENTLNQLQSLVQ